VQVFQNTFDVAPTLYMLFYLEVISKIHLTTKHTKNAQSLPVDRQGSQWNGGDLIALSLCVDLCALRGFCISIFEVASSNDITLLIFPS
jgi:hypothetical protein